VDEPSFSSSAHRGRMSVETDAAAVVGGDPDAVVMAAARLDELLSLLRDVVSDDGESCDPADMGTLVAVCDAA
jgi:hypothetical protein